MLTLLALLAGLQFQDAVPGTAAAARDEAIGEAAYAAGQAAREVENATISAALAGIDDEEVRFAMARALVDACREARFNKALVTSAAQRLGERDGDLIAAWQAADRVERQSCQIADALVAP